MSHKPLTQRRMLMSLDQARGCFRTLAPWAIAPLDARTIERAFGIQDDAGASWWDSLILASALLADCRLFVSEDLQDGRVISGMRIANPVTPAFAQALQSR